MLAVVVVYSVILTFMPAISDKAILTMHYVHSLFWLLFHYVGLGLLLRAQSESKFLVRHYIKNYYYPERDIGQGPIIEAFNNWKAIYNFSMCMTYGAHLVPHYRLSMILTVHSLSSLLHWRRMEIVLAAQRLGSRE